MDYNCHKCNWELDNVIDEKNEKLPTGFCSNCDERVYASFSYSPERDHEVETVTDICGNTSTVVRGGGLNDYQHTGYFTQSTPDMMRPLSGFGSGDAIPELEPMNIPDRELERMFHQINVEHTFIPISNTWFVRVSLEGQTLAMEVTDKNTEGNPYYQRMVYRLIGAVWQAREEVIRRQQERLLEYLQNTPLTRLFNDDVTTVDTSAFERINRSQWI